MEDRRELRVAIIGGTGFAGHNVRNELEGVGVAVGVFSRTSGCDLLDLPAAWAKLDAFRPTHLVNCAALVGSVNYVTDFAADVVDVNMRLILNIYKLAQQMRDVVVVNPIANCAYPGVMDVYEEKSFWDGPIHPSVLSYGSTRRMMWALSKCYADQYGVRSVNLIVPNMYGPFDSTNPNKTHALNALVIKFVRAVKEKLPEIEVWGTGKPIREWLYVKDFAAVVRRVVQTRDFGSDLVNIAQNRGYTVTELVEVLKQLTNYQGRIAYNTRYQDGSPKKVMDDHVFCQRFPDFTFTSLADGLRETTDYYRRIL
ncbi:MAG: NAD-dependent epimerase/dehydratase family protein [candidate division WOR-3 bacterium]|nr:NAD-dependent epimerase/dehydratase family protein [candidate division WOR-3 bacterium]